MSSLQVAVLPGTAGSGRARPAEQERDEHAGMRLAAFAALGLYGVLRWNTMLGGQSPGHLIGLLVLAAVLATLGPAVARRSRVTAAGMVVLGAVGMLAIAGLPLSWILHVRVAVSARAIGEGLSSLPRMTVPYSGLNEWLRVTIILGAAVLLFDAVLVLVFVPRHFGHLRRAGAALPLVALAVIPATVLRPGLPYLEGLLLFALVVVFMWGERIPDRRLGAALLPCVLAGAAAIALAPSLDRHHPWIDYRSLAGGLAPGGLESFDWDQGYGGLHWPRTGRGVLEVQASHADYWKAEDLDMFDGRGWSSAPRTLGLAWQTGVRASALRHWRQTLQVTVRSMETSKVIAAGAAFAPHRVPGGAVAGAAPGTWQSEHRMGPGDTYRVSVYAPHPSRRELASAGHVYPAGLLQGYLSLLLPDIRAAPPTLPYFSPSSSTGEGPLLQQAVLPPFGATRARDLLPGTPLRAAIDASPYAGAFAISQRLAIGASTPFAYVRRVEEFLARGYRYSLNPPQSRYPLETFLVTHKLGYCEHFAGAMALLLRMGGVPARVAAGFTPGSYDAAAHRWLVTDRNAHAWVEAWFPRFGWVRFDPTPAADPALKGHKSTPLTAPSLKPAGAVTARRDAASRARKGSSPRGSARAGGGGPGEGIVLGAPAAVLALLLVLGLARAGREEDPVAELERAFARSGRPLGREVTLASLERRLAGAPEAVAYLRALRLARFGHTQERPPLRQRRALRRALGQGLGPIGKLRALWALPPRWRGSRAWKGNGRARPDRRSRRL